MCIFNRVLLNFRKKCLELLKQLYGSANFTPNCQYSTIFSNAKLSDFWFVYIMCTAIHNLMFD